MNYSVSHFLEQLSSACYFVLDALNDPFTSDGGLTELAESFMQRVPQHTNI
jgi:hypothetical protein